MKHKILLLSIALSAFLFYKSPAQQFMKLNKTDGSAEYYALADIQKITFNELVTGNPEMDKKTAMFFNQLKGFPNPAGEQFTLAYSLAGKTPVVIKIFTAKGELVKQVDKGTMNAGDYTFVWGTKDNSGLQVTNGTYLCQVMTNAKLLTNKLIIIRH